MARFSFEVAGEGRINIIHGTRKIAIYDSMLNVVYMDLFAEDPLTDRVLEYVSSTFQVRREDLSVENPRDLD